MFIRREGPTAQFIDLQFSNTFRGEFTLNLAWHHETIPSPWTLKPLSLEALSIEQCFMQRRIGLLKSNPRDEWFSLQLPEEELRETLHRNLTFASECFGRLPPAVDDLASLCEKLTPELLAQRTPREKTLFGPCTVPACWSLFDGWRPEFFNILFLVLVVASRNGDVAKTQAVLELARDRFDTRWFETLNRLVSDIRND